MVPETANYIFTLKANDGARLLINQVVVFDHLEVVESEIDGITLESSEVVLTADEFVPIKLEYF